jgi:hypothetical protein
MITIKIPPHQISNTQIREWGEVMKMAKRASSLAGDAAKDVKKRMGLMGDNPNAYLLYTDDPTSAVLMAACGDMAAICGASEIVGVLTVMGENFPADAFEAERPSPDHPRIAALWLAPSKQFCPRCRSYRKDNPAAELCERCETVIGASHAH